MTAPTDTTFSAGTKITSEWLNGVNDHVNNLEADPHPEYVKETALALSTGSSLVGYGTQTVETALNERLPEIGTYTLLRAYTGPVTAFYVRGVTNIFDGGAGVFRVDVSDTTSADNGGTILVDAIGRRWFREFSGAVNLRWFVGATSADVTSLVQAAALASKPSTGQGFVDVPNGVYKISSVGIRDVVFRGESRDGVIFESIDTAGSGYMFDACLNLDGVTSNTSGNGWCENMTIDAKSSGRSGLRTYGGGASPHQLVVRNGDYGIDMGLPMWANVRNCYLPFNRVGFHTYSGPGDAATSLTVENVWADACSEKGFHITQLYYSSFINSVAQNTPIGWHVEGDAGGIPAVYSLQFIGCGHEGTGTPFVIRKVRDLSLIGPRIVGFDATTHIVTLDDVSGSVQDFSTAGSPGAGYYHLHIINSSAGAGSIQIIGGAVTYASSAETYVTNLGCSANSGASRLMSNVLAWGDPTAAQRHYSQVSNLDGYSALCLYANDGQRLAAYRRIGTPVFSTNGAIFTPETSLNHGDVSFYVDTANSRLSFVVRDESGNVKTGHITLA